jgi:hypothetical protein
MVRTRTRGKIAFVSSLLAYMSIVGYSNYSPGKHALRGILLQFFPRVTSHSLGCICRPRRDSPLRALVIFHIRAHLFPRYDF